MRAVTLPLQQVLAKLNELLVVCRDGRQGYETAAQAAADPDLAAFFHGQARQHAQLAGVLKERVHRMGGEAAAAGSVSAAVRRGWMPLKAALVQGDDRALIAGCEREEAVARRAYEEARQEHWPEDLEPLLAAQYETVREAHDRLRLLARVR